jgi:hypothetical protein
MPNGPLNFLKGIFQREGQSLAHFEVLPDHVADNNKNPVELDEAFRVSDDYVVISIAEMFLGKTRVLWREFYPVVHSFVNYGNPQAPKDVASVAGPGQLKDLGTANLDRVIGLAYTLAGPIVYDGQPIELLSGLYAVPAKDGAAILIQTLSQLSGLVPQLGQAVQLAGILKGGAEQLLGLDGTKLTVGLHQTFYTPATAQGLLARPGFVVAAYQPAQQVDPAKMWVIGGRLYYGDDPVSAEPAGKYDYILFQLSKGPSRVPTWATIPALAGHSAKFDEILKTTPPEKVTDELHAEYRRFDSSLRASPDLTKPDQNAIRALVKLDLKERSDAIISGDEFLSRSAGEAPVSTTPKEFRPSLLEIPDDLSLLIESGNVPREQVSLLD